MYERQAQHTHTDTHNTLSLYYNTMKPLIASIIECLITSLFPLPPDEGNEVGKEDDEEEKSQHSSHHSGDDYLLQVYEILETQLSCSKSKTT